MDREQLREALHIEESDPLNIITEKLFLYALIQLGPGITEEVLRNYSYAKKIVFE